MEWVSEEGLTGKSRLGREASDARHRATSPCVPSSGSSKRKTLREEELGRFQDPQRSRGESRVEEGQMVGNQAGDVGPDSEGEGE